MVRIGKKEVQKLLTAVLNKKGKDHCDPNAENGYCVYFEVDGGEENPVVSKRESCIVGHVAVESGNDALIDRLRGHNGIGVENVPGIEQFFTHGAVVVLDRAQFCSDEGYTWGWAVAEARAV